MLGVTIFAVFFSVLINDATGSLYSVDEDFPRNFNKEYCDGRSDWYLLNPASVDENGSVRGIIASKDSCATSSPVLLTVGSTLELYVYMKVASKNSGVSLKLTEEPSGVLLASYVYNGARSDYVSGWSKITVPVEINSVARVTLLGSSLDDELVIVKHLKHIPPVNVADENNNLILAKEAINTEAYAARPLKTYLADDGDDDTTAGPSDTTSTTSSATESILKSEIETTASEATTANDNDTTSSDTDEDTSTTTSAPPNESTASPDDANNSLDWVIIVIIGVSSLIVVIIVAASCYYLGKRMSKPVIIESTIVEPPPTMIIPRVKEVSKMPSNFGYD